jgi:hypothetical protein
MNERAILAFQLGHVEIAERDVQRFLTSTGAAYLDVIEIVRALIAHGSKLVELLPTAPAFRSLDPTVRYEAAWELFDQREHLVIAEVILRDLLIDVKLPPDLLHLFRNSLVLALMGQRRFADAIEAIGYVAARGSEDQLSSQDAFNYAMANWGKTGEIDQALLKHVTKAAGVGETRGVPNHHQCLAIAYWALGDLEHAKSHSDRARQLIMSRPRPEFSAWRYLRMHPIEFVKDLDQLDEMLSGKERRPAFLS